MHPRPDARHGQAAGQSKAPADLRGEARTRRVVLKAKSPSHVQSIKNAFFFESRSGYSSRGTNK